MSIRRIRFAFVVSLIATHFLTLNAIGMEESDRNRKHPNVLLIMTDDQGWGDIQSHGNPDIRTPNLDQLAASGARFDRFYVSAVCAPTRAGLLTGRYHLRTGTHGVTRGRENMSVAEFTIAERFKEAGYATGCFGKWHNGAHYPMHPNGQGFDEFVGFCAGHWNNYFSTRLEENGKPIETEGYIADVLTDHALRFIEQHGSSDSSPFFCYVPLNTPHSPWQVPESYFAKYQEQGLDEKAACAYAMCENIDDNVGRLLETLERLKIEDETIVVFLTDNGPNSNRFNGEMRGRKGSVHEGGHRVPLFIRYPGQIEPGTVVKSIAANIDLFPTLVELAKLPESETDSPALDGQSLVPGLSGEVDSLSDRLLFSFRKQGERGAVRAQRWRAVKEKEWQLYQMIEDPGQTKNVASEYPEVMSELRDAYAAKLNEIRPELMSPIRIPLGYEQREKVTIPAHEAILIDADGKREGNQGIGFHGGQGWANDWISKWTSADAVVTWEVKVASPVRYRATLLYACPADSVGDQLQMTFGGKTHRFVIEEESDEPFVPSPDRIDRGEVYERSAWGRVSIGEFELQPGEDRILLQLLKLSGDSVCEIKGVELKLVVGD